MNYREYTDVVSRVIMPCGMLTLFNNEAINYVAITVIMSANVGMIIGNIIVILMKRTLKCNS